MRYFSRNDYGTYREPDGFLISDLPGYVVRAICLSCGDWFIDGGPYFRRRMIRHLKQCDPDAYERHLWHVLTKPSDISKRTFAFTASPCL